MLDTLLTEITCKIDEEFDPFDQLFEAERQSLKKIENEGNV